LPQAPTIRSKPIEVRRPVPAVSIAIGEMLAESCSKFSVPKCLISRNSAIRKPKSPMRFTIKAFFPAAAAESLMNQNPISRYDARPTPSQPMNISR